MVRKPIVVAALSVAGIGLVGWASTKVTASEFCKPVVPQIAIEFAEPFEPGKADGLMVMYDERGSIPYTSDAFTNSPRFTSCHFEGARCSAERMRYEVRVEPERFQSIQIRFMGAEDNRIVGAVRWLGPSYPERVTIACDAHESDPRRSCRLKELAYAPDPDRAASMRSRHDRCRPGT